MLAYRSMTIPIVFSTDHNFVMQTGVCICSLIEHATCSTYQIFVLINDDVSEEDKCLLREQVSMFHNHTIDFVSVGSIFDNAFEIRGITIAAYSRLLIPWLLPEFDKVIYSDVDVIFKIDLGEVFSESIEDSYFGAVPSIGAVMNYDYRRYVEKLGIKPQNYFNSGFLIINSKLQREANLKEKILHEVKNKYIYQDQDVINIVAKNRIKSISPEYCITQNFYQLFQKGDRLFKIFYGEDCWKTWLEGEECIIHYAGPKPWNTFTYAWREWWNTYAISIFYDPEYEHKITKFILCPKLSWRNIAGIIKRKMKK